MTDPATRLRIVEEIERALEVGPPVAVATVTAPGEPARAVPGEKVLVRRDGSLLGAFEDASLQRAVIEAAREAFTAFPRIDVQTLYLGSDGTAARRRHEAEPGDTQVMLQLFEAPARLVVVGGGHIGLALAQIGELTGFTVVVIDDREAFANRERFPMADEVRCGEIADELRAVDLGGRDYVVLVSRGHKQDEEALREAVGRGAAYVGMIGSRRRTATVLQHLLDEGFDRDELEAVSTPIGLDIGAETPEEIALSILAEIVMLRRGGTGRRMREGRAPLKG